MKYLVYFEETNDVESAIKREKQIKAWKRSWKLELIEKENPAKPLSDQQLMACLKEEGIRVARRTVAKYRDMLRILPSHLRRRESAA